ncbi:MAG: glycosyltransferase family 2 protein, partial [Muribaculaceae bacterium]|nr:glycosyltransferase family 2 protein [Muribaculaceae bacterium]
MMSTKRIDLNKIERISNEKEEKRMDVSNEILVSVIIPVYNAERYLKTCLNTIISQTYKNLEIICVNDGSTDHSLDILELFAKKDKRIKIINQNNSGPAAARNAALKCARGDYISFVDADDFLQYNAYEILVECALQEEKWDLIIFGGNVVGERNDYISDVLTTKFNTYRDCKPGEVIFREKAAKPFIWLHFIKKELLVNPTTLYFDESFDLGEDQLFLFGYVPRAKNVMVIDQKLYNYRINQNASLMQLYRNRRVKKTEMHFSIVDEVAKAWKEYG